MRFVGVYTKASSFFGIIFRLGQTTVNGTLVLALLYRETGRRGFVCTMELLGFLAQS